MDASFQEVDVVVTNREEDGSSIAQSGVFLNPVDEVMGYETMDATYHATLSQTSAKVCIQCSMLILISY